MIKRRLKSPCAACSCKGCISVRETLPAKYDSISKGVCWRQRTGERRNDDEKLRLSLIVFVVFLLFTPLNVGAASAAACVVSGPRYQLVGDTVDWSISIGSGQSCVR